MKTDSPVAAHAREALMALANPVKADFLAGFFKTGKGEYGEGDQFLGITVPAVRGVAMQFRSLPLKECEVLLQSKYNDVRLLALIILVRHYERGDESVREAIFQIYLKHRQFVNNWNLVDSSAAQVVGAHLLNRNRKLLYELVTSKSLWDRRIAVISTFAFIRKNDFTDIFKLSEQLLEDRHDLMHKACGWMLREVGKRDESALKGFLKRFHQRMPRTMLRYAIERFSPAVRKAYLAGKFD